MDVVLVGLPGSGKSVVGKRLAQRHRAAYIDLDAAIEREAGAPIAGIFESEGEAGFRARERAAVAALGPPHEGPELSRVVATGGGAVVDPRNRWGLYRGRLAVWLDGRPEVLAQRLRRSATVRPLVTNRDPIGSVRALHAAREPFYAAAERVNGIAEIPVVVEAVDRLVRERSATAAPGAPDGGSTVLLRADTRIGRVVLGERVAVAGIDEALRAFDAQRAILVSEPGAWGAVGAALQAGLEAAGWPVELVLLPRGEAAKRLSVVEDAAGELARLRVERGEPLVAVGGGALGDTAGFLAATYLRGVPFVQLPTTLVAQLDSSIGGKTGVDLPAGKNLVGAFHQPAAIVIDVSLLRSLPERQLRAALGEAVKMAVIGDERLWELIDQDGPAIARGEPNAWSSGAVAELVEHAAWAKVRVVLDDEREAAGRAALNLGHSLGHAFEAAAGYEDLLHGEAVGYGLRAAARIGVEAGLTPPDRAARLERTLDGLGLAGDPLPLALEAVIGHLGADKKHRGGRLGWVIPTADGVETGVEIPDDLVRRVAAGLLAPAGVPA
ncbi:MAG: bifunctional shikimate kinase/3-dehydroquinate synthase [Chloroflexi bacterium]|nr:bifunctional shikimate kinase/3-dehydroquinate synthase [Chloroflexota bacterium]